LTSGLVIDASVSGCWCFPDEASSFSEAVFDEVVRSGSVVPALWVLEMANLLANGERRGRIKPDRVSVIRDAMAALPIEIDQALGLRSLPTMVRTARDYDLTAYDASYLELAMRTHSPLATLDKTLKRAAAQAGVALFSV